MPSAVPLADWFKGTNGNDPATAYSVGTLGSTVQQYTSWFGAPASNFDPYNFYEVTLASTSTLTVSIALDGPLIDNDTFLLYKGPVAPGQPSGSGIAIMDAGDALVSPIYGQASTYDDANGKATIAVVLPAGTYYVKANNPAQGNPGGTTYTIDMSATPAGSKSLDLAGSDTASPRTIGALLPTQQVFTDYAGPGDGYDYYSFTVTTDSIANIAFTAYTPSGVHPGTSGIALVSADRQTEIGSDLVEAGTASISQALAAGTYYLKVDVSSGYEGYDGTDYQLSLAATPTSGTGTPSPAPPAQPGTPAQPRTPAQPGTPAQPRTPSGGGVMPDAGSGATMRFIDTSVEAQAARLYRAAFGRTADSEGLAYWSATLHAGTPLVDVAAAFVASQEFQARYGNSGSATFVTDLYRNVLHRPPEIAGLTYWKGAIDNGTLTRPQVLVGLSESPENAAATPPGADAQAAARLYHAALGRAPDSQGLTFWTSQLSNHTATLVQEADALANSPEFISHYGSLGNAAFVGQLYRNVLGRAADAGGLANWTGELDHGATRGSVVTGFSESAEARARFASVVGQDGITVS